MVKRNATLKLFAKAGNLRVSNPFIVTMYLYNQRLTCYMLLMIDDYASVCGGVPSLDIAAMGDVEVHGGSPPYRSDRKISMKRRKLFEKI